MAARLYLITPPALEPVSFAERLKEALDAGDVACLAAPPQGCGRRHDPPRRRNAAPDRAKPRRRLHHERPARSRARDRLDGVHVGQEDASYDEARRILGLDKIVGVTCYASRHIAMEAAEKGADYVAFGGFFPSPTKQGRRFQNDPEILHWWSEMMTVPSCAIGGITPQNCAPLVAAGVDFLAVISAVWSHPQGPGEAVRDFAKAIAAAG